MRAEAVALIAAGLLSACATSPAPSLPPISMPRPEACLAPCPPLPLLVSEAEGEAVVWVHEVIDVAGQCRRLHDACRAGR